MALVCSQPKDHKVKTLSHLCPVLKQVVNKKANERLKTTIGKKVFVKIFGRVAEE